MVTSRPSVARRRPITRRADDTHPSCCRSRRQRKVGLGSQLAQPTFAALSVSWQQWRTSVRRREHRPCQGSKGEGRRHRQLIKRDVFELLTLACLSSACCRPSLDQPDSNGPLVRTRLIAVFAGPAGGRVSRAEHTNSSPVGASNSAGFRAFLGGGSSRLAASGSPRAAAAREGVIDALVGRKPSARGAAFGPCASGRVHQDLSNL